MQKILTISIIRISLLKKKTSRFRNIGQHLWGKSPRHDRFTGQVNNESIGDKLPDASVTTKDESDPDAMRVRSQFLFHTKFLTG